MRRTLHPTSWLSDTAILTSPMEYLAWKRAWLHFKDIRAVALEFTKPENMTREIETLGKILGKEAEAQDYINWYNEKRSTVEQAVQGLNKPKVYAEWSSPQISLPWEQAPALIRS